MTFNRDSSVLEPLQNQWNKNGAADEAVLEMIESNEKESIAFQLWHSDRLYANYFRHMNSGRLKVSYVCLNHQFFYKSFISYLLFFPSVPFLLQGMLKKYETPQY